MRRLIAISAAALVLAPAAAAKNADAAIVVGPTGSALVEPYAAVSAVLRRVAATEAPVGAYALVYVQRRLLPGAPGRWYPRSAVYCDARSRCVHAPELVGWFGSGRVTGLYRGRAPRLAGLVRDGRRVPVASTLGWAIELAFAQGAESAARRAPVGCVAFGARWVGSPSRPRSFCVGMNGGVYAGGRQYPLYSGIAARLAR